MREEILHNIICEMQIAWVKTQDNGDLKYFHFKRNK